MAEPLTAGITRDRAFELLNEHNKDPFHITHGETVEGTMRYFAREFDPENEEFWGIVGLLHDLDWEKHEDDPMNHTIYAAEILEGEGASPELIHAIQTHTSDFNTSLPKPELQMEKILFACDELTGLIGARAGVAGCLTLTVLVSALLAGGDTSYTSEIVNLLFISFISGFLVVIILHRKPHRQQVLLCGFLTGLSNMVIILTIGFMTNNSMGVVMNNALWSALSAVVASVLCIALDALMEAVFRLATPAKLLELSNPNQPILRRLMIEASGTYHHSIIVANLAEAAAETVGANPLLCRAGAYYHDIGKLKRPMYFKENQLGENPHEHTNPYISAAIVTAHTRDGVMLAQQYHLPQEIQDIIIEHHGDTPVMYFYHKALKQADGQAVDIADFRYDGRRPQSKESAIIMLADTVEAAVRSMPDPTPKAIEEFIAKLVRGKIDDGQLNDAPLTLQDISKICRAFTTVLKGVFHERIEYPSISPAAAARLAAHQPKGEEGREESQVEARELKRVTDVAEAEREAEEVLSEESVEPSEQEIEAAEEQAEKEELEESEKSAPVEEVKDGRELPSSEEQDQYED